MSDINELLQQGLFVTSEEYGVYQKTPLHGSKARELLANTHVASDIELLHLSARAGYRVKEVGVRWRDDGDSRLDLVAGNARNLADLLRIRFGRYATPVPAAAAERTAPSS